MRAAYERLTSILSDPDECGMSALDCIYEIMENEVQRRVDFFEINVEKISNFR